MNFIQWCDDNTGFLAAILSLIGLILSAIAIVVSIRTARLPYKKRIILGYFLQPVDTIVPGVGVKSSILEMSVSATNAGNRTVTLTYLGYAVKKDGRYNAVFLFNRELFSRVHEFNSKASLAPSEKSKIQFHTDELIEYFSRENRNRKLFVYAEDTEGKKYMKKLGTVGELLDILSSSKYIT